MSTRKYIYRPEKLYKKIKKTKTITNWISAMDKIITSKKQNIVEVCKKFIKKKLENNENIQQIDNNKGGHDNVQTCNVTILNNEA